MVRPTPLCPTAERLTICLTKGGSTSAQGGREGGGGVPEAIDGDPARRAPVGRGARGGLLAVGEGTREIQAFLISQVRNVGLAEPKMQTLPPPVTIESNLADHVTPQQRGLKARLLWR